jgi:UDP-2,4-diacetamido-2,4,6-trideoxy-beta-L-altropyranose hydrolase
MLSSVKLNYRLANIEDLELLFEWANEPTVRNNSLNSAPISMLEHTSWFNKKLKDDNCYILILETENSPIGYVRFEVDDFNITTSILVNKNNRGKGYSLEMLNTGLLFIRNIYPNHTIKAEVKDKNTASLKIFQKANFKIINKISNVYQLELISLHL